MFSGKGFRVVAAMVALSFGLSAQAASKRYAVLFKSPETFKAVAANATDSSVSNKLFNRNAAIKQTLNSLNILVVESDDQAAIESLRQHPAVALVEEEIFHPAPKVMATFSKAPASSRISPTMDTPWGILAVKAPDAWITTKGENARVLVLDTGLDLRHPALRNQFEAGRNFTVEGAPEDFNDLAGHGTHVAGTILADGVAGGLVGVAPMAKLLMGKVCAANGCGSIAIMNGLNYAVEQNVSVVNMSLGGFFISEAEIQALIRAEAAGVMVVAASGNGGTSRVSFPTAFDSVLSVGAVDSALIKAPFSQWGPELDVMGPGVDVISSVPMGTGRGATTGIAFTGKEMSEIASLPFVGSPLATRMENELVFAGLGKETDFAGINLQGKFALISRGEITFKEKVERAIAHGAAGVVMFNNAPGLMQGSLTDDGTEAAIPAVMIEQSVGEQAKADLALGQAVRVSFSIDASDYASFQGTSMATPHVAGVAALVRSVNPSLSPAQVRDLLKATAIRLGPNPGNEYGSGLVDAHAAVEQAKTMSVGVMRIAN
ncbi:MAG TPA: S8 family serine peptidase [Bdellovibrionales bacterium]|nr:S8 family serine peptidase [Bdellovibrionales bacterium]